MKLISIVASLLFCQLAFAQSDAAPTDSPKVQIHQMKPDYDVSGLKSPDVEIHPYQEKKNQSASVNREEREDAIAQAGLKEAVKSWDELDRDVLYLKAQNLPFEKLTSQYPKIDKTALKKFYEVARGGEK